MNDEIPKGFYQHKDRNLFCLVEGTCHDTKTDKLLVLHKRFSDNFQKLYSMNAQEFIHNYEPRRDWATAIPSALQRDMEEACKITVNVKRIDDRMLSTKYLIDNNTNILCEDDKIVARFKNPEQAKDFCSYLDQNEISWF